MDDWAKKSRYSHNFLLHFSCRELNKDVKIKVEGDPEDPHFKANLLVQSYLLHLQLPISDYNTDLKSVLDQCIRILQAMMDVSAEKAMLGTTLAIQSVLQNMIQARWLDSDPLWQLPFMSENLYWAISKDFASDLPTLVVKAKEQPDKLRQILKRAISDKDAEVVRLNCFILNGFYKITHLSWYLDIENNFFWMKHPFKIVFHMILKGTKNWWNSLIF